MFSVVFFNIPVLALILLIWGGPEHSTAAGAAAGTEAGDGDHDGDQDLQTSSVYYPAFVARGQITHLRMRMTKAVIMGVYSQKLFFSGL